LYKFIGASRIPLSDKIRDCQLCIGVNCRPRPCISVSELAYLASWHVLLFGIAELPNFITLNPACLEAAYSAIMKFSARHSDVFQQSENRSLGYTCHPARSPDGIPFHESRYNGDLFGERESVHVQYYA
jgi:hypothetical protein